jgi:hypothetical protein
VTLSAAADAGSTFSGWSGGGCSGTGACTTTITAATTITATFGVNAFTLTVTRAGGGTGTVTSNPAGINCGTDCSEAYGSGTAVTLTAMPASGSTFSGWTGGGCSGTGTCTTTITAATAITATFGTTGGIQRLGNVSPFDEFSDNTKNFLLGERVVVPQTYTLLQFGYIPVSDSILVKFALYTDSNGAPATLVAQTPPTAMYSGFSQEIDPTVAGIVLAPGTYWIMAIYEKDATVKYTTQAIGNVVRYKALSFGAALPSSFGTSQAYTDQSFNYWIVVQP